MIDWLTIKPELLDLIGDLAELQSVWLDKRRPYIDPKEQATVFLHVRQTESIGIDDRRYEVLPGPPVIPAPALEETAVGHRRVLLEIRVESFRHDDDRFAFFAAEKIRSALSFRSSLDRLRGINVAIIRKDRTLDLSNVIQDDRVTSVAILELVLAVGICVADTKNPVFNIETVNAPGGTLLPPC